MFLFSLVYGAFLTLCSAEATDDEVAVSLLIIVAIAGFVSWLIYNYKEEEKRKNEEYQRHIKEIVRKRMSGSDYYSRGKGHYGDNSHYNNDSDDVFDYMMMDDLSGGGGDDGGDGGGGFW
jgi:uncharacterized membrane protein YgcG